MFNEPNKKKKIYCLNYTQIEQELNEDDDGLYVNYQGKRLDCTPALNTRNETIPGVYIGIHFQQRQ